MAEQGQYQVGYKTRRKVFKDRESWLEGRENGIGASEASAVLGFSPWLSSIELWKRKVGLVTPREIVGNAAIDRGKRMEGALRNLFAAQHPEYRVDYHEFDILYQANRPWLTATLDGELHDEKDRFGVLEIKTALCSKRTDWEKWKDQVPDYYAVQCFHQMLATGAEFVKLYAWLCNIDGDASLRTYTFERSDHKEDLDYLLERETEFWGYVEKRIMPPMVITF